LAERIAKWRAALSEEKQDEKRMKACEGMKRTRAKKTPEEKELNNAKRRKGTRTRAQMSNDARTKRANKCKAKEKQII
jgi:hypothetical protein